MKLAIPHESSALLHRSCGLRHICLCLCGLPNIELHPSLCEPPRFSYIPPSFFCLCLLFVHVPLGPDICVWWVVWLCTQPGWKTGQHSSFPTIRLSTVMFLSYVWGHTFFVHMNKFYPLPYTHLSSSYRNNICQEIKVLKLSSQHPFLPLFSAPLPHQPFDNAHTILPQPCYSHGALPMTHLGCSAKKLGATFLLQNTWPWPCFMLVL